MLKLLTALFVAVASATPCTDTAFSNFWASMGATPAACMGDLSEDPTAWLDYASATAGSDICNCATAAVGAMGGYVNAMVALNMHLNCDAAIMMGGMQVASVNVMTTVAADIAICAGSLMG